MNAKKLEFEIFSCEDWGRMNRIWLSNEIEKARKAGEITGPEKVKLYELIGDELERQGVLY